MRSGVNGVSTKRTPKGNRASSTAPTTAATAPMAPPSAEADYGPLPGLSGCRCLAGAGRLQPPLTHSRPRPEAQLSSLPHSEDRWDRRRMADCLDAMTIGIQHEGAVIVS